MEYRYLPGMALTIDGELVGVIIAESRSGNGEFVVVTEEGRCPMCGGMPRQSRLEDAELYCEYCEEHMLALDCRRREIEIGIEEYFVESKRREEEALEAKEKAEDVMLTLGGALLLIAFVVAIVAILT